MPAHQIMPLMYPYFALEPYIDTRTMLLHHDKHYTGYVRKYNELAKNLPEIPNVVSVLTGETPLPEGLAADLKWNAGGIYCHELYFSCMGRKGNALPRDSSLDMAIQRDFGGMGIFKRNFSFAADSVKGCGWVWLASDLGGNLSIETTSKNDTILSRQLQPLLILDVFEHAYYLKYQNKRSEYVAAWFNVVAWKNIAEVYAGFTTDP